MVARRKLLGASFTAAATSLIAVPAAGYEQDNPPEPREALARLMSGNRRWVSGSLLTRDPAAERRRRVAGAQHPYAVVFSCIDSRVPPEYVFDADLGELFVVRTAAQCLDPLVTGCLEYGPAHGTGLIFVLGHTSCGAVRATVEAIEDGVRPPGNIGRIVSEIRPAYRIVKAQAPPDLPRDELIDAVVTQHTRLAIAELRADPLIAASAALVEGGRYSLATGEVTPLAIP